MIFDFPGAGGCVDGGKDEGHITNWYIGGSNGCELGLFVDEGEDGEEGVGGSEEDKEENTYFKSFFLGVEC